MWNLWCILKEVELCENSKNDKKLLYLNKNESLNLNEAAALGIITIGNGFYSLEEFLGILDIPCMSNGLYHKLEKEIDSVMQEASKKCMREAFDEEVQLSVEKGEVDKNGDPILTVMTDAAWSKRSYKSNYSAKSESMCVIATRTILYWGEMPIYSCYNLNIEDKIKIKKITCFNVDRKTKELKGINQNHQ